MRRQTRRSFVASSAGLAAALAGCSDDAMSAAGTPDPAERPAEPAGPWPMEGFDAMNSGHAPESGPREEPIPRWRHELGTVVTRSSPVVVDGLVVTGDAHGTVYGIDAYAGDVEWTAERDDGVGPPAIHEEVVFVPALDGQLVAYDPADGSEQWRTTIPGGGNFAPTVANGSLFVPAGETVLRVDPATGTVTWRGKTGTEIRGPPAVHESTVVVCTDTHVECFDVGSEGRRWRWALEGRSDSFWCGPAVADSTVLAVSKWNLHALDLERGEAAWPDGGPSGDAFSAAASPAVVDGTVVAALGGDVVAVEVTDGSIAWRTSLPGATSGGLVVDDRTAYVATSRRDDRVHALSLEDGATRWIMNLGAGVSTRPAVVGGTCYLATDDREAGKGYVYALAEPTA